jgi:uncharacterized membrane protein
VTPARRAAPWAAVIGLAAAFAAAFAVLGVRRHDGFFTARYDLGNMTQAVWSVAHGGLLRVTDPSGIQMSRLGAHVDPILAAFAPLWRLWPDPRMLIVAQALAVASAAIPAFLIARRWLVHDGLAVAFAAATLLLPALQWATLFDFHPVALAMPLLLWCVWAADTRHDVTLGVVAALAALTKEQVALSLVVLGIWMAVSLGRRRAGAILAGASLAWTVIAFEIIIPHFNRGSGSALVAARYGDLGSNAGGVLRTLLTHPWDAAATLATADRAAFVGALVLPMLALCLRAPLLSACGLPDLLLNLLSSRPEQHHIEYHYGAVIVPFVVAGSIRGLAALRRTGRPAWIARIVASPALVACALLAAGILGGWLLGPLPFWRHVPGGSQVRVEQYTVPARAAVLKRAVDAIPAGAAVSAGNRLGGHLSDRARIMVFPTIADARFVLIDLQRPDVADDVDPVAHAAAVLALRRDPRFRVRFERDGVVLFERVGATP